MKSFALASILGAVLCAQAHAADRDDIYIEGSVGPRFQSQTRSNLQGGAAFGYCFFDNFGFGLRLDQYLSFDSGSSVSQATQGGVEGRWFVEPLEVAFGIGGNRSVDQSGNGSWRPAAFLEVDYLWAWTPSLALKGQFSVDNTFTSQSGIFVGAGVRVLY